jgi:hypothetical protein
MDKLSKDVEWKWADGQVAPSFSSDGTRAISGTEVNGKASDEQPAHQIGQDDGDKLLNGHSELKGIVGEDRHVPPDAVAKVVERGLALREKLRRAGTIVGIARARDLKNRKPVSDGTIRRMAAFFARHATGNHAGDWRDGDNPSPDDVAFLLWGGKPGREWAEREKASMDEASRK